MALFHTRGFCFLAGLGTFLLTTLTLVFFRTPELADALRLVSVMLHSVPSRLVGIGERWEVLTIVIATLVAHNLLRNADLEERFSRLPIWLRVPVLAIPILCLFVAP